jgi:hypothetical protein
MVTLTVQPLYLGEGDIIAHGMRSWIGSSAVLDALGEESAAPCQDLHSAASSPYPIHDSHHAILTPLVGLLAKHMIFLSKSRLDVFSVCVSVQFYVYMYIPRRGRLQKNFVLVQVTRNSIHKCRISACIVTCNYTCEFLYASCAIKISDNDGKIFITKIEIKKLASNIMYITFVQNE